jgi:hypothetical protein
LIPPTPATGAPKPPPLGGNGTKPPPTIPPSARGGAMKPAGMKSGKNTGP